MRIKCCKNCEERKLKCHSTCTKYIEEKKSFEQEKIKMINQRKVINDIYMIKSKK